MLREEDQLKHGKPQRCGRVTCNRDPARDRPGRSGVAEGFVVATKPGNSGGAKGPRFKETTGSGKGLGDWR